MASTALGAALRQVLRLFDEGRSEPLADGELLTRFLDRGDGVAFETLMDRHGPMVRATCRALVSDPADSEDAFQATFLILIRRAGSVRDHRALGGWLHRVAHRVAVQANLATIRRRDRERRAGCARPAPDPARDEVQAAVHEELARLPDRFRLPVILCHLEGKTHAQAAGELGWGEATVRRRLADARDRLRRRLTRRGFTPSAAPMLGLTPSLAAAPVAWSAATLGFATGRMVSPSVLALASATVRALALGRAALVAKVTVTFAASVGLFLSAVRFSQDGPRPDPAPQTPPATAKPAEAPPLQDTERIRGTVRGPDGQPFAGARIRLWDIDARGVEPAVDPPTLAVTGADGRFEFVGPGLDHSDQYRRIIATADGFGPAWALIVPGARSGEIALQLAGDDSPVEGRIFDLEGRPVAGAEVGLFWLAEPSGGVAAFLASVGADAELHSSLPGNHSAWFGRLPGQSSFLKTSADGRFRLTGLGRDRVAELVVRGPMIAEAKVTVLTRPMEPVVGPKSTRPQPDPPEPLTVRGSRFDFVAIPTRPLTGVIRDRATREPIAGIRVISPRITGKAADSLESPSALSDANGRFTLMGHPKGSTYIVAAVPPPGSPFVGGGVEVADTPGLGPVVADLNLVAGIPFQITPRDTFTGRPVPAIVEYYPLRPNPHVRGVTVHQAATLGPLSRGALRSDSAYHGVVLPGPGAIVVRGTGGEYIRTRVDPGAYFQAGVAPRSSPDQYGDENRIIVDTGSGAWHLPNDQFHDLILIDRKPDDLAPIVRDARLLPAPRRTGQVLGPDRKPLVGAKIWNGDGSRTWSGPLEKARFELTRLDPDRPRPLVVRHDGLKLAGQFTVVKEGLLVQALLKPWATLSGRLVDKEGKPRPGLKLLPFGGPANDPSAAVFPDPVQTDPDGRFRVEGLVPGLNHRLAVLTNGGFAEDCQIFEKVILKPGETRDLGDIRAEVDRPKPDR